MKQIRTGHGVIVYMLWEEDEEKVPREEQHTLFSKSDTRTDQGLPEIILERVLCMG